MSSSLISLSSSDPTALVVAAAVPAPAAPVARPPFEALYELHCPVTIVLGTASITVRQCLGLALQTVFRLDQAAGEDLRIDVNGVTIARGEVAILDTTTAIRLTDFAPAPGRGHRT